MTLTANHSLVYRLAELMLQRQQLVLPVDLLFEDEQIGEFVKSIQIDSPYQQLLLEGVCTESIREEQLYVSFTTEGYFHYVLGEVLHANAKQEGEAYLFTVLNSSTLAGLERGVSFALDHQVREQEFRALAFFIKTIRFPITVVCVEPILTAFTLFGTQESLKLWFSDLTNDQVQLLHLIRKRLVYSGKKVMLTQFDDCLWEEIRNFSNPNLAHLYVLSSQLSSRDLAEIETFYSQYKGLSQQAKAENSLPFRMHILEELGRSLLIYSEKKIALSSYEEAMELAHSPERRLHLKSHVAQINKSLSNTDLAIKLYKEIIKESNSNNLWTIESATKLRLGEIYKQQNAFSEAGPLFGEVVSTYRKRLGNYHGETARALGYLGSFHIYLKEWEVAKGNIEESMQIRMRLLGEFNTKTCISYVNYAEILMELGDFEKSSYYFEKALAIRSKKFGRNHQDVAYTIVGLGNLFLKKGDPLGAKKCHEEALEIRMLKLGTGHYFTQQSRWALLQIYGQLNEFGEFLKLKEAYLSLAGDEEKKKQTVLQLQTTYFN
jgi:tetratricopeptide (TPR) repeat protein